MIPSLFFTHSGAPLKLYIPSKESNNEERAKKRMKKKKRKKQKHHLNKMEWALMQKQRTKMHGQQTEWINDTEKNHFESLLWYNHRIFIFVFVFFSSWLRSMDNGIIVVVIETVVRLTSFIQSFRLLVTPSSWSSHSVYAVPVVLSPLRQKERERFTMRIQYFRSSNQFHMNAKIWQKWDEKKSDTRAKKKKTKTQCKIVWRQCKCDSQL